MAGFCGARLLFLPSFFTAAALARESVREQARIDSDGTSQQSGDEDIPDAEEKAVFTGTDPSDETIIASVPDGTQESTSLPQRSEPPAAAEQPESASKQDGLGEKDGGPEAALDTITDEAERRKHVRNHMRDHVAHRVWDAIGFFADEYGRTHDEMHEGHHNVMYGTMAGRGGEKSCRAQKYRAPSDAPHHASTDMLIWAIWTIAATSLVGILLFARTIYEFGRFGFAAAIGYRKTMGNVKYRQRHRIKNNLLNLIFVVLPAIAAVFYQRSQELSPDRWHDRREIMVLSVVKRGVHDDGSPDGERQREQDSFRSAKHHNWLSQSMYNFLGVDCEHLEAGEFVPGPKDSAWTILPLGAWALDHTWKHHKYVYWADPSLVSIHDDIGPEDERRITAHEHMQKKRMLVVDEKGGLLLHTGPLSRKLLSKAKILCRSPLEHPLVALLALAVGGDNWHDAVSRVAYQSEKDGRWTLKPIDTVHAKVLARVTLPVTSTEPWCE
eukprot:CAMPEP_0178999176 /NCGR_PEP_ID=MMETSP0795-20121207/9908_1 /TAXON_ID=88552 /ORGANISM="Amoebophrya sp., Strain Ameob2" /LENGTH=496 /DNA_ID=CAMNT_0020691907 /DNA_START=16 /DNA_END=1506 /DNA_ORIENTATION=-